MNLILFLVFLALTIFDGIVLGFAPCGTVEKYVFAALALSSAKGMLIAIDCPFD